MTESEVIAALKDILLRDFKVPPDRVTPEATIRGGLGLDSLDAVDLVYLLSKHFQLPAQLQEWRELDTVGKVIKHIVVASSARGGHADG